VQARARFASKTEASLHRTPPVDSRCLNRRAPARTPAGHRWRGCSRQRVAQARAQALRVGQQPLAQQHVLLEAAHQPRDACARREPRHARQSDVAWAHDNVRCWRQRAAGAHASACMHSRLGCRPEAAAVAPMSTPCAAARSALRGGVAKRSTGAAHAHCTTAGPGPGACPHSTCGRVKALLQARFGVGCRPGDMQGRRALDCKTYAKRTPAARRTGALHVGQARLARVLVAERGRPGRQLALQRAELAQLRLRAGAAFAGGQDRALILQFPSAVASRARNRPRGARDSTRGTRPRAAPRRAARPPGAWWRGGPSQRRGMRAAESAHCRLATGAGAPSDLGRGRTCACGQQHTGVDRRPLAAPCKRRAQPLPRARPRARRASRWHPGLRWRRAPAPAGRRRRRRRAAAQPRAAGAPWAARRRRHARPRSRAARGRPRGGGAATRRSWPRALAPWARRPAAPTAARASPAPGTAAL